MIHQRIISNRSNCAVKPGMASWADSILASRGTARNSSATSGTPAFSPSRERACATPARTRSKSSEAIARMTSATSEDTSLSARWQAADVTRSEATKTR